jgi:3-hydroxypropanoate dehydrogenase
MNRSIDDAALDQLFRAARSHDGWLSEPVSDALLRRLYELMKWGPTTSNAQPQRIVFLRTPAAKARLAPAMSRSNQEKTLTAPVVAILAFEPRYWEHIERFNPRVSKSYMELSRSNRTFTEETALRNASLQGAYFIIAARALGLDCGPMSGFDNAKVDAEFFPDGRWKSNFLCAIGRGDPAKLRPRLERFDFDEACRLL